MTSTHSPRRAARGISLLEALVAVAVMAIGLMGLVGLQATLRGNADGAKQRSQAVRLADELLEQQRGFSVLDTTVGRLAYDDIVDIAAADVALPNESATYQRELIVDDQPAAGVTEIAPFKQLAATVRWRDRNDEQQSVTLFAFVTPTPPEVLGALAVGAANSPLQQAGGRNLRLPPGSIQNPGQPTSTFTLPGNPNVQITMNNVTLDVTRVCANGTCTDITNGRLVSGYVRFATGSTAPTGVESETPPSPVLSGIGVRYLTTAGTLPLPGARDCFVDATNSNFLAYYCVVRLDRNPPRAWTGRLELTGLDLASGISDNDASRYRVCRYTIERSQAAVGTVAVATGRALRNEDNPYTFREVISALVNQNFLVIRAGTGAGAAFDCPEDDSGTPLVNGRTWHHQPPS